MASDKLFRKPALNVVQGDTLGPMYGVVGAAATVTYLVPGKLVSMLTNDNEIDIGGTADASFNVGILGYEDTPLAYKPATRDTAYAAGDHVAIHNTPGMRFRGWVQGPATAIAPGDMLVHGIGDSSGNFTKQVLSALPTNDGIRPLARALETLSAAQAGATTATECWMQWL